MAQRLFQFARRTICDPLKTPKTDWVSPQVNLSSKMSTTGGKKEYTKGEKYTINTLKVLAIFLPGVYVGYLLEKNNGSLTGQDTEDSEKKSTMAPKEKSLEKEEKEA